MILFAAVTFSPSGCNDPGCFHGAFTQEADALKAIDVKGQRENGAKIKVEQTKQGPITTVMYGTRYYSQAFPFAVDKRMNVDI